jgi:2-keto-4-pentenoate hydratase/2-oxohepta-3-ene-1,7-dioic acid hydratase in catechol pathway
VTGRRDPPKAQRVLPDIFLGSRSALSGHRDTVYREHGAVQFDFELEVTAVIGKKAFRVSADKAEDYVAGYTIGNDLTTHHGWWRQIRSQTTLNDNIRMKNFPGYTPLGPVVVPKDIVGDPHALHVRAWQDGVLRQDANTSAMIWKVGELIEYLSWIMPLRPGDLILTGSPEELPLPPGERRVIKPVQTVICEAEKLGRLETRILEQDVRQPNEVEPAEAPHG